MGIFQQPFLPLLFSVYADDDPLKIALDEFHAEFGSDDGIFLVYKPADGNVFSARSLEVIKGIRNDLLNFRAEQKDGEESMLNHIIRIISFFK